MLRSIRAFIPAPVLLTSWSRRLCSDRTIVLQASSPWSPTGVALYGTDVCVLEYLHTAGDNRRKWLPRVRKAICRMRSTIRKVVLLLSCVLSSAVFISCNAKRQVADRDFDTTVAQPAFTVEHPRVLFDEAHRNIHTADGLYQPFADLIRNDGFDLISNQKPFSEESLSGHRILVIANALGPNDSNDSSAFTADECDAVRSWVEAGGSLLLITDHAPTGSAAQDLAQRFGVQMSKGFTEDSVNCDRSSGDFSQLLFTRENGLFAEHPIISGRKEAERVNRVMTFTGQSLKGPEFASGFLTLGTTAVNRPPSIRVEKSGGDTRVIIEYGDPVPAHGHAQGLALQFGRGRIVMLGEAAMLTAQLDGRTKQPFGMNVHGIDNRQLALNIMHWLAGIL